MISQKQIKSCLVISYGPVPTPQYQTVEGGGMRAWGLAEGLTKNGVRVTVAINNSFPQELAEHEGIRLTNWGLDQSFIDLINSYDAVIVSYCMGGESVFVAENLHNSVQLILDVYVPIYVEVSARESKDIDHEYRHYMEDVKRYNRVLRRGDYFLCANEVQKRFYTGVLSALGVVNPRSYREGRIIIAPFGIHDVPARAAENPFLKLGIKESDFTVMWFGGLYPWFRIEELLEAILALSRNKDFKFVIVGGKNPFNPNPDFFRQYEKARTFAVKHKLLDKSLFFVDWVDFDKRINWFKHADVVVSLNQPGEENGYSWRTRVMDFVWGELAIVTNGGDPLSEDLLAADAAIRLKELSTASMTATLEEVYRHRDKLRAVEKRIIKLKPDYFWQHVARPVAALINAGKTPYNDELGYRRALHLPADADVGTETTVTGAPRGKLHQVKRLAKLPPRIIRYARQKGLKRSAQLAMGIAKTQVQERLKKRGRRYIFISHPINDTGAPVVLMQIIREYAAKYGGRNIHVVAPHLSPHQLRELREAGVKVDKAAHALQYRLIKLQLNLKKDDFVLINTLAVYDNYRDFVLHELEHGHLERAYWFIHEDKAQIPRVNPDFVQKRNLTRIRKLADKKKLTIVVPSKRTQDDYNEIIGTKEVQTLPLLVDVPDKYRVKRAAGDYRALRFFISGTPDDGRKGQLIAIAAFYDFMTRFYQKQPKKYRDFSLHLLAIGDDYVSQQIRWIGGSLLGPRLSVYPSMPRAEALKLTASCNVVMCCSLNETFGLYIAEAMFMGHVVVRNNSAGVDEQLQEGVNGYLIDHTNVPQIAKVLEKLLNKDKISDQELRRMGEASQKIISDFGKNDYLQKIESLQ